ncbi:MAG: hypothetical protein ACI3ZK_03185 [Candidatus Cryptobacteroides sp.]
MEQEVYLRQRKQAGKQSVAIGAGLAVLGHVLALLLLHFNGLSYIYPPPEESSFVIDFSEEELQMRHAKEPVAENVDTEKPVDIVQKSESPVEEKIPNQTQETPADDFGDVAAPQPEAPKLDPRASFPGMGKKPSQATTAHSSQQKSKEFKAGQSDGNSPQNITQGKSNAHLKGRNVVGNLAQPKFDRQIGGVVVVSIWVDVYGNVKKAVAGAEGTTVNDSELWTEARNAAMKTHFSKLDNITEQTSELQEGTITYIFKLK